MAGVYIENKCNFIYQLNAIIESVRGPWLVFGDLNLVLDRAEKVGGTWDRCSQNKIKLHWKALGLRDLGFTGSKFTWWNKQDGMAAIFARLDKAFANADWIQYSSIFAQSIDNVILVMEAIKSVNTGSQGKMFPKAFDRWNGTSLSVLLDGAPYGHLKTTWRSYIFLPLHFGC